MTHLASFYRGFSVCRRTDTIANYSAGAVGKVSYSVAA
jgi:hypothetical protein